MKGSVHLKPGERAQFTLGGWLTQLRAEQPWWTQEELVGYAIHAAALGLPTAKRSSVCFDIDEIRGHRAELNSYKARSVVRSTFTGADFGAANPAAWHPDWSMPVQAAEGYACVELRQHMQENTNTANWRAATEMEDRLREAMADGPALRIEQGSEGLGSCLVDGTWIEPLAGNHSSVSYLPLPNWFAPGQTTPLPNGAVETIRALASEMHLPGINQQGRYLLDLSGGQAGIDAWLVFADDSLTLHATTWGELKEMERQRIFLASIRCLYCLALGLSPNESQLSDALRVWEGYSEVDRPERAKYRVPLEFPCDLRPALPAEPGHPVPVALTLRSSRLPMMSTLAHNAAKWVTVQERHWQHRWSTRKDYRIVDHWCAPHIVTSAVGRAHSMVQFGEVARRSPAALLLTESMGIWYWRASWSGQEGRPDGLKVVTVSHLTATSDAVCGGVELVRFLQALCHLARRIDPDVSIETVWVCP